jgi:hypothetical protein
VVALLYVFLLLTRGRGRRSQSRHIRRAANELHSAPGALEARLRHCPS